MSYLNVDKVQLSIDECKDIKDNNIKQTNRNFILLNKTIILEIEMEPILDNFPKKRSLLSNSIEKVLYEMIEALNFFQVNNKSDKIKMKYLKEYVAKLSMFDLYINISHRRRIINHDKFVKIGKKIAELRRIAWGLAAGIEKND